MNKWMKSLTAVLLTVTLAGINVGCGKNDKEGKAAAEPAKAGATDAAVTAEKVKQPLPDMQPSKKATNFVRMDMAGGASIVIQLFPQAAPLTVANFQKLVGKGFYNGLTFHRAVPQFVIQGGDPSGNGSGGSDETVKGEFLTNGIFNPLKHKRGVVSMARSQDKDSASSQFFIVLDSRSGANLNDQYAAFGDVIYGMDEVDRIAALKTNNEAIIDKPVISKAYFITQKEAESLGAKPTEAASAETKESESGDAVSGSSDDSSTANKTTEPGSTNGGGGK